MKVLVSVVCAGAVGVGLRYWLDTAITSWVGSGFPWATLLINIVGAFGLGILIGVLAQSPNASELIQPAVGIGLLGGFTTFSTYALDAITLAQDGKAGHAVAYIAATNMLGIAAAGGGLVAGRGITNG